MARNDNENRQPSVWFGIFTIFHFIVTDIILYSCICPLAGTYLAGCLSQIFGIPPKGELVATVVLTFVLIYATFCLIGEAFYWKKLFSFDFFYCTILKIRDVINAIMFMFCLYGLASVVEAMVNDGEIKSNHVGATYVFFKTLLEVFKIDAVPVLSNLGISPPHKGSVNDAENAKFEHGAAYVLLWAILTSCVAKLVYYNTLFTYLRAMEIFMTMKPTFGDDDVSMEASKFSFDNRAGTRRIPSRRENDYTVKRTDLL